MSTPSILGRGGNGVTASVLHKASIMLLGARLCYDSKLVACPLGKVSLSG